MFEIDTPTADEMALVYSSWCESYRKSPWAGCIPNNLYHQVQRACIHSLLVRGARIAVALAPRVPGIFEGRRVVGWICWEPVIEVVHYFYTKADFRHHGVASALIKHATDGWFSPRYSHRTRASEILGKKFRWDPCTARMLSAE